MDGHPTAYALQIHQIRQFVRHAPVNDPRPAPTEWEGGYRSRRVRSALCYVYTCTAAGRPRPTDSNVPAVGTRDYDTCELV
jgi:hypothetical protein